jgi:prevent-host-death family protein
MKTLQLQKAKAELSKLVEAVQLQGPTVITVRGREKAVLISKRDYDKKLGRAGTLYAFFRESPLCGSSIRFERDPSLVRKIRL